MALWQVAVLALLVAALVVGGAWVANVGGLRTGQTIAVAPDRLAASVGEVAHRRPDANVKQVGDTTCGIGPEVASWYCHIDVKLTKPVPTGARQYVDNYVVTVRGDGCWDAKPVGGRVFTNLGSGGCLSRR